MKTNFSSFIILALILLGSSTASAQLAPIVEEELGIDLLKWHYARYPNSQENKWFVSAESGNVQVTFLFEGVAITAVYNNKGKIQAEKVDMTTSVPVSLVHELDQEYADDKYKIVQFVKTTNFVEDIQMYEMEIKSKTKGVATKKFDVDLIPLAVSDYSTSVSAH